jgi:hypothetical protein
VRPRRLCRIARHTTCRRQKRSAGDRRRHIRRGRCEGSGWRRRRRAPRGRGGRRGRSGLRSRRWLYSGSGAAGGNAAGAPAPFGGEGGRPPRGRRMVCCLRGTDEAEAGSPARLWNCKRERPRVRRGMEASAQTQQSRRSKAEAAKQKQQSRSSAAEAALQALPAVRADAGEARCGFDAFQRNLDSGWPSRTTRSFRSISFLVIVTFHICGVSCCRRTVFRHVPGRHSTRPMSTCLLHLP